MEILSNNTKYISLMRYLLTLRKVSSPCNIPISYQPYITSNIYRMVESTNPGYSDFLHNEGYKDKHKKFKYFTFGPLNIPKGSWELHQDRMLIYADKITLVVSFLMDKAQESFVMGLFQKQTIEIKDKLAHNKFVVEQVQVLPVSIEDESTIFRSRSPLVIAQQNEDGKDYTYLAPDHSKTYADIFINNLVSKYLAYVQTMPNAKATMYPATPRFEFIKLNHPKPKSIIVKGHNTPRPIKVKGYLFDFRLTAPKELLEVGYLGGFGSNNAQGFGYCEVVRKYKN